jgi:hypothetical protein
MSKLTKKDFKKLSKTKRRLLMECFLGLKYADEDTVTVQLADPARKKHTISVRGIGPNRQVFVNNKSCTINDPGQNAEGNGDNQRDLLPMRQES